MISKIETLGGVGTGTLDLITSKGHLSPLEFISFILLIFLLWSRSAQGDGYLVQWLFGAKNKKYSVLSALWFNFSANVMMTWSWIIVGLGSLIILPLAKASPELLADPELGLPDDECRSCTYRVKRCYCGFFPGCFYEYDGYPFVLGCIIYGK